jgi:hypothetical protein
MEAYTSALFLADEKKEFMELYCYQSFSKTIIDNCVIKNGEGLIGWVLRENKNVLAANFERNTQTLGFYEQDEKIKSLIAIPMPNGMGVVFVDSKKSYSFTEEKEKIFKQFSLLLYTLINEQKQINNNDLQHNYCNLFIQLEQCGEKYDLQTISSLLFENINLSHFYFVVPGHCAYTCFYSEEKKRNVFIEHFPQYYSSEGLLGWCIKNRKNLVNNKLNTKKSFPLNEDENRDINNLVGIPVYEKKGDFVGVFGFVKKRENETFLSKKIYWHSKEIDFLELLAKKILTNYAALEMNKG